MHVLNDRLLPSPDLVRGAIFIGGKGLAQGYWRNPEETAARFITHPLTSERLYRTGDQGRVLRDGNIELFGRDDFQVKVRGHRVELGEIESALSRHPMVREVVVVAREDAQRQRRLVAYVAHRGEPALAGELTRFLEERLPRYMVPAAFLFLESLPVTSNGKIDRGRLPAPEVAAGANTAEGVPRTRTEKLVAGVLEGILSRDGLTRHEPFFAFGCTSIHMIQMHRKVSQALEREFPVGEIFNCPTIAALAAFLDRAREDETALARARPAPAPGRAELAGRRKRARK
jgi:hypothetical protein